MAAEQPRFPISVCTVNNGLRGDDLFAWLRHHRNLGVNHFFIYDLTDDGKGGEHSLAQLLTTYVSEGLVTLVPWYFRGCIVLDLLLCPEPMLDVDPDGILYSSFSPPAEVHRDAALVSCFLRFGKVSDWTVAMHDNEFIQTKSSVMRDLPSLISNASKSHKELNVFEIESRSYHRCDGVVATGLAESVPRMNGSWVRTALAMKPDARDQFNKLTSERSPIIGEERIYITIYYCSLLS